MAIANAAPIQYALERLPTGYGKPLCYAVLPFVFGYQLNRDNSAVLVMSPLLFADDGPSGWCLGRDGRFLERCHDADDVASNLARAI